MLGAVSEVARYARQPDRTGRTRRVPRPPRPSRSARACGPRSVRTSSTTRSTPSPRSCAPTRPRPRTDPRIRRLHPLLLPRRGRSTRTLADELRNIDRYLTLERARFGDALKCDCRSPRRCSTSCVPFLALQPLVENAVRHGFAGRSGGSVEIVAARRGHRLRDQLSRTTASAWIPKSCAPGPATRWPTATGRRRPRRADQCRPSPARGVRQRLRSGGRDGDRRGHQGRDAGTRSSGQGVRASGGVG